MVWFCCGVCVCVCVCVCEGERERERERERETVRPPFSALRSITSSENVRTPRAQPEPKPAAVAADGIVWCVQSVPTRLY